MIRNSTSIERVSRSAIGLVLLFAALPGCADISFDWSSLFPGSKNGSVDSKAIDDPITDSAAYRGTIAEQAYFDGMRRLRLRGFGIVVGLGDKGSSECPTHIKNRLVQEMLKKRGLSRRRGQHISPTALIADPDTAVVAIEGEIPAAALSGTRFDLTVRALPGTQTTSLEGGWLFPCDLKIFRATGGSSWIQGKQVATGSGPVFINPFGRSKDSATKSDVRRGLVIGGGKSLEDRRVRLMLTTPSYQRSTAIAERINERFGTRAVDVADAISPSEVRVHIPQAYEHEPKHFLELVQRLFLPTHPGFRPARMKELAEEFAKASAPHVEIALAWEAMGRTVLPSVQRFYDDTYPPRSFHAASAGVRLGDPTAVDILESHLLRDRGRFQLAAIRVLSGAHDLPRAARPLRRALSDDDPRIRVAAYEALRDRGDPTVTTIEIGEGDFALDLVRSNSQDMIYATRTEDARIALFADDAIQAHPPLFYGLPDDSLIIDAEPNAENLTLVRRSKHTGTASPAIRSGFDVAQLIRLLGDKPPASASESVTGLGVRYSSILLVLSELSKAGSIEAHVRLEDPNPALLPGAIRPPGRPESEL
jgi:Flagellar P-ring protein/HEAT repeats